MLFSYAFNPIILGCLNKITSFSCNRLIIGHIPQCGMDILSQVVFKDSHIDLGTGKNTGKSIRNRPLQLGLDIICMHIE